MQQPVFEMGRILQGPARVLMILCLFHLQTASAQKDGIQSYREIALEESKIPVRPGIPGITPFWNGSAIRFIYAPAFDFKPVPNAGRYQYEITSEVNGKTNSIDASAS